MFRVPLQTTQGVEEKSQIAFQQSFPPDWTSRHSAANSSASPQSNESTSTVGECPRSGSIMLGGHNWRRVKIAGELMPRLVKRCHHASLRP